MSLGGRCGGRRRKGYRADGPSACAGDLEELRGRAFVLKEGVDYRVKVSFKVRRVCGALCPLAGHGPAALTPREPGPEGSLFPWELAPQGVSCHPWVHALGHLLPPFLPLGSVLLWGSLPTLSSPASWVPATLGVLAVPSMMPPHGSCHLRILASPRDPSNVAYPRFS